VLEVSYGKNIAAAANSTLSTLGHLIWSSLVDSKKWSNGKYTSNYHFDSKAHVYDHIISTYPELAQKTSQLFMGSYMSNSLRSTPNLGPHLDPSLSSPSSPTFVLAWPQAPSAPEPYVDTPSDTGKFVSALEELGPGKKLFGVSDMRSGAEFMRVWSAHLGVRGLYREVSREEFMAGVRHEGLRREVADSRGFNAEFGWCGGEEGVLMPGDVSLIDFVAVWLTLGDGNPTRVGCVYVCVLC
jgi:hypothetical protein